MENISEYREIARMLKDGKTVVKKTRITKERCLEESLSGGFTLVICGGGHISYSLCNLAKMLGYQVWIIDDREEFANEERFPQADHVYCMGFEEAFDKVIFPESAWYVIVTRGHQNDYECLKKVMERKSSYVGMIGSKGKVRTTLERLKKDGVTKEQQEQIHAPIGLPIGANTPEEITVSIMAEMIQEKSKLGYTDLPKEMIEWLLNKKQPMVMTTIVGMKGSAPRGVGARMLVAADGSMTGTMGGGAIEHLVLQRACIMLEEEKEFALEAYDLTAKAAASIGMICGGYVEVLFEKVI